MSEIHEQVVTHIFEPVLRQRQCLHGIPQKSGFIAADRSFRLTYRLEEASSSHVPMWQSKLGSKAFSFDACRRRWWPVSRKPLPCTERTVCRLSRELPKLAVPRCTPSDGLQPHLVSLAELTQQSLLLLPLSLAGQFGSGHSGSDLMLPRPLL